MSEEKKFWLRGNAKLVKFENGSALLQLGVNPEQLVEALGIFNAKRRKVGLGPTEFINVSITKRKEEDNYGNTHSAYVDFFVAEPKNKSASKSSPSGSSEIDDLPF